METHKTHMLILDKDDPEKELEFEIDFQLSFSPEQRYKMVEHIVKDWLQEVKMRLKKDPSLVILL